MAMLIVQEGPGLPVLSPLVYECITTGKYPKQIPNSDVLNPEVQSLIAQVLGVHVFVFYLCTCRYVLSK